MDRILFRTQSWTGARSKAGTSSGAREGSQCSESFTSRQHSVLAAGEEGGSPSMRGWQVNVPTPVKERVRAGQGYEVESRPSTAIRISLTVTPREPPPESYSSLVERKWRGKQVDPDRVTVLKEETGGVKSEVTGGGTIGYAQVEVVSGDGDQISSIPVSWSRILSL